MPYIIKQAKVIYVTLGSKEMEANNVYMTEKAANVALLEGEGQPSAAQLALAKMEEQSLHEQVSKERDRNLNIAEQNFKRRLAAGAVGRQEIMDLWTALHRAS